jgi:hypothetical protein
MHRGDGKSLDSNRFGEEASDRPAAVQAPSGPSDAPTALPAARLWSWALAAGVFAGILAAMDGERIWPSVRAAQVPKLIPYPTKEDRDRIIQDQVKSTAVSFVQQGAILGVVLGLAGGLARRSTRAAVVAAVIGGGLGAGAGAVAAHVLLPVYYEKVEPEENALALPLLTHGGIWAAVGAAAGLALGLGLGGRNRWARCAVGGLLGGLAATMVYDLVGALALPLDKTSQPVAATVAARIFGQLAVAVLVAAGGALGAGDAPRRAPGH